MWNSLKTGALLALLSAVLIYGGRVLGGPSGMTIAFGLAIVMNIGSWWFSDRIVLMMSGAQPVSPEQAPQLYEMVEELAKRANLPMPRVYVIPQAQPNAFATGRSPEKGVVAVTEGILRTMPPEELRGVLAHELAHIANRDTLIMAVATTIASTISMLANMAQWAMIFGGGRRDERDGGGIAALAMIILAPITATLIQLAISRSREFMADEYAARLLKDGRPLARALSRLERGAEVIPADVSPTAAHLYIVNPLRAGAVMALFRTHPTTEQRIARLEAVTAELQPVGLGRRLT
jgi:heat shock protein HtpX